MSLMSNLSYTVKQVKKMTREDTLARNGGQFVQSDTMDDRCLI